jgi:hypothetical protein
VNKTFIGKTYDSQVKGYCYSCDKIGRLSLPKDKSSIYLIQPFLNLQLYIPQGANFSLELLMSDLSGDRRRFFLSTAQYEAKINALHVNLPMPGLLRGKWVNVVFDLASLMNENFRNQVFRSLNGLTLSGTFKLRKIFTLKFRPPDTSGAEVLDYDYANKHIEAIPRAISFPIGVENIAQIFNMNRILISASKSSQSIKSEGQKATPKRHAIQRSGKKPLYPAPVDNRIIGVPRKTLGRASEATNTSHNNDEIKLAEENDQEPKKISPKIMSKLPPIIPDGKNDSGKHEYSPVNILKAQHELNDSPELHPNDRIEEPKLYDPKLYFSPNLVQETEVQNASTTDQLQNEIDEFFKRHESKTIEKEKDIQVNERILNVSQTQTKSLVTLGSQACNESTNLEEESLIVSSGVGPNSQPYNDVLETAVEESYNQISSDDELQKVTASLNNLLSDLKHDSETTLFPGADKQSKDMQFGSSYHDEQSRKEESIYCSSDEEADHDLELVFDPLGNSFTDPRTGKRYILDD